MSRKRELGLLPPILHRQATRPAAEHLAVSRQTALANSQSAAAVPLRWQTAFGDEFRDISERCHKEPAESSGRVRREAEPARSCASTAFPWWCRIRMGAGH